MAADLEKLAKQFRNYSNPEIADGISEWAKIAREKGIETFPEQLNFTPEAIAALIKEGYSFVDLKAKTIGSIRQIKDIAIPQLPDDVLNLRSRLAQVAFNSNSPFIEAAKGKSFEEQLELLAEFNDGLKSR